MTDRMVELESAVAHLEATVDALREELVDANERIRALEQELEEQPGASSERSESNATSNSSEEEAGPSSTNGSDETEDIIVA